MSPASSAPQPFPSPPASDFSFSGSTAGHIARLESVLAAGAQAPVLGLDTAGLERAGLADFQVEEEREEPEGLVDGLAVEGGVDEVADLVLPTTEGGEEGGGGGEAAGQSAPLQGGPPHLAWGAA